MVSDNPELDGTDGAHPAWWRSHEQTMSHVCSLIDAIVRNKDDGKGVASEPWETTRRTLLRICDELADVSAERDMLKAKIATTL